METVFIVLLVVWVLLYYVESSARKKTYLAKHAWLARATKHLLFFAGIGLFLIQYGTDWNNRRWEVTIGMAFILIGLLLSIRTCVHRKQIQQGLGNGTVKPLSEGE
jgi:protein-S-isoprenylcysteine O-methyltransferase Ste14